MIRRLSYLGLALAASVVLAGSQLARPQHNQRFNGFELVDKEGNIHRPTDYRDRYEALGTYTVLDPKATKCTSPTPRPAQPRIIGKLESFLMGLC